MSRSIMQNTKECFLCRMRAEEQGYFGPLTSYGLEKHHVMHGVANRKIAEKYGLTVFLCEKDHRTGAEAVHKSRETDLKLIRAGQRRFEQVYSHREWMKAFGKNYLYEDFADNNVLEQVLQQLFKEFPRTVRHHPRRVPRPTKAEPQNAIKKTTHCGVHAISGR